MRILVVGFPLCGSISQSKVSTWTETIFDQEEEAEPDRSGSKAIVITKYLSDHYTCQIDLDTFDPFKFKFNDREVYNVYRRVTGKRLSLPLNLKAVSL